MNDVSGVFVRHNTKIVASSFFRLEAQQSSRVLEHNLFHVFLADWQRAKPFRVFVSWNKWIRARIQKSIRKETVCGTDIIVHARHVGEVLVGREVEIWPSVSHVQDLMNPARE